MDYVAFEAETTAIVADAADVGEEDSPEVAAQKIADWKADGGLLAAIVAGDFDEESGVIDGDLSDMFTDNIALDPSGLKYSSEEVADYLGDSNRKVPNRGTRGIGPSDRVTDAYVETFDDIAKLNYVPLPTPAVAWATNDVASVNSFGLNWDGTEWANRSGRTATYASATAAALSFTRQISNYSSSWSYAVSATNGTAVVNGTGLITVSGLTAGQSSTVTVVTTRAGYLPTTGTTTGTASP